MRKRIVAGNWKMNKTLKEARELTRGLMDEMNGHIPNGDVILVPAFPVLEAVVRELDGHEAIAVGAQNMAWEERGAYTGEVSVEMLQSVGVTHVLIGHSERRQYMNEDHALLKKKLDLALSKGVTPIYCCGEQLEDREAGRHFELVGQQIEEVLFHLDADALKNVVIAYEPVWAIGTGLTATSAQAEEMHAHIRQLLAGKFGDVAEFISILYGGSCKPDNAPELFACPNVDGGLIGGASLKVPDFMGIIKAMS